MLNETQLLMLNNLIYLPQLHGEANPGQFEGMNVGKILESIKAEMENSPNPNGPAMMTKEEWLDVLNMALGDSDICSLTVNHLFYEEQTDAGMACFVDPKNQAYAVFSGTGANEWRDDAVAGMQVDSQQQLSALDWFDRLPYDDIVVSGHSKGGNKAMYVTIRSDKAGQCYSFDGEGFSNEFLKAYEKKIAERAGLIHLRANARDYVHVLIKEIPGIDAQFVHNDKGGISSIAEYHCPNALFQYKNGRIVYSIGELSTKQDPTMDMLHGFTEYLLDNASEAELTVALSVLGELLTKSLGGSGGDVRTDILDIFTVEGIDIVLRYLSEYLKKLQIEHPLVYLKYKKAFMKYVGDIAGFDVKGVLLGEILLEPLAAELFDMLTIGSVSGCVNLVKRISGGGVQSRDFSRKALEQMRQAAGETEEEAWWRVDRWDCWYRIEQSFGMLRLDRYAGRIDEYYRKLIDINDSSVEDIERIFAKVYALDSSYSGRIGEKNEQITSSVENVLTRLSNSIVVG